MKIKIRSIDGHQMMAILSIIDEDASIMRCRDYMSAMQEICGYKHAPAYTPVTERLRTSMLLLAGVITTAVLSKKESQGSKLVLFSLPDRQVKLILDRSARAYARSIERVQIEEIWNLMGIPSHTVESESDNENCLEGMRCPCCGSNGGFYILSDCRALWTDDGVEDSSEFDYEDTAKCECAECHYQATAQDFRTPEES